MMRIGLVVVLGIVSAAAVCCGQQTTGHLEGRLLDGKAQPVAFANIVVTGPDLPGQRMTLSFPDGYFHVMDLPVGVHDVAITHIGYQDAIVRAVSIQLGRTTSLGSIQMEERIYTTEAIEVSGRAPLIDPAATFHGANLPEDEFAELPIGRSYTEMTFLLPHVNASAYGDGANFAGGTGLENQYFIDGMDVTDPFPEGSGSSTNLPYNFIREVQVRSGGYQAEYRSALGGIVDVVTHSGSNEWHGQLFGFLVNNRFTDSPRVGILGTEPGDFAQYDVGGGFGGPIARDRLWFYAAYNPSRETEDVPIPGQGIFEDRGTVHRFATKLTWRADASNDMVLSVFGDPGRRDAVGSFITNFVVAGLENADPYLEEERSGGVNIALEGRHRVNESFYLTTSLSRLHRTYERKPATPLGRDEILVIDADHVWSGGAAGYLDKESVVLSGGVQAVWLSGAHTVKAGYEYRDKHCRDDDWLQYVSVKSDTLWQESITHNQADVHTRVPSLFLQDSWRLGERLRLNYGLRWDGLSIVDEDGTVLQSIGDQWQPRLGFTYQPGRIGTQQFSGSIGRFYQETSTFLAAFGYSGSLQMVWIDYDHDPRIDPSGGTRIEYQAMPAGETAGLKGQHYDEATLGYERWLGTGTKVGIRGIYRTLRRGIDDGYSAALDAFVIGNVGYGDLDNWPRMKRDYKALELSLVRSSAERFSFRASYVLSRTEGNYPGLFLADYRQAWPNLNANFDDPETLPNSDGLLPNDRPHAVKLSGSWITGLGLTVGGIASWMSGTPLNEYGVTSSGQYYTYLVKRGSAGRTPSIWDLDLRLAFRLPEPAGRQWRSRIVLDLMHIGSPRRAIEIVQTHYRAVDPDGNPIDPDPFYGEPFRFQPPFTARLGLEVEF
jgi:hypothetical protein